MEPTWIVDQCSAFKFTAPREDARIISAHRDNVSRRQVDSTREDLSALHCVLLTHSDAFIRRGSLPDGRQDHDRDTRRRRLVDGPASDVVLKFSTSFNLLHAPQPPPASLFSLCLDPCLPFACPSPPHHLHISGLRFPASLFLPSGLPLPSSSSPLLSRHVIYH
ncbi:hypothetical protein BD626DRAFT_519622 [Schizophyllum amplum]|uniref:Uncharacterized protein n=1 Tax=Schizophyllum amplum TaxID=97359 RepID=A0A550BV88_9AGAR|nr:hypothetical protein BD626DRAFT_519622 [Auriculariopsis ampla]